MHVFILKQRTHDSRAKALLVPGLLSNHGHQRKMKRRSSSGAPRVLTGCVTWAPRVLTCQDPQVAGHRFNFLSFQVFFLFKGTATP